MKENCIHISVYINNLCIYNGTLFTCLAHTQSWKEIVIIIIIITRYDYNLTIMKSPKRPQTTGLKNILKATFEIEQCWIFAVLWRPFWKWRLVEIFQCRESIQDDEIEQCWICAVLWWPFWKWRPVEIFRC